MDRLFNILLVEDYAPDADLIRRELGKSGLTLNVRQAATEPVYLVALTECQPDLILCDFTMPGFGGERALELARQKYPDVAFIFVSETMGEETAVQAIHKGATDYVLKSNLMRLNSAVYRALEVTAHRRARQILDTQLRESELRFRQIAENIKEVFWITDPSKNTVLYVSPAYTEIWGRPRETLKSISRDWLAAIHPEDLERVSAAMQSQQVSDKYDEEYRIVRADGSVRWIHDKAFSVRNNEGAIYRIVGVAEDITERKKFLVRLQESEAVKAAIIESALDCLVTIDANGKIVEFNPAAEATFGIARHQALGASMAELIVPASKRGAHDRGFSRHLATGESTILGRRVEQTATRADGEEFPIELSVVASGVGPARFFTAHIRDISLRKEQERKIARLTRIYAVLSGIDSAIVRIRDRQQLFDEACRIAGGQGAFRVAWFAYSEHGAASMKPVAWGGIDAGFFDQLLSGPSIELSTEGVAMRAVLERRTIVDDDIARNPNLDVVRQEAIKRGCRAVIGLPLYVDGEPAGAFLLYSDERNFFDQQEVKLLEELAGDISFSLTFLSQQEKVHSLAYYDTLTGLPNRSLLFDRLGQQCASVGRDGSKAALVLIDLDRFRMVNDTLGRRGGDALLTAVAQRLSNQMENPGIVARVAADRFALTVSYISDPQHLVRVIEKIQQTCFDRAFMVSGEEIRISARAGIAVLPADGVDAESLFANAEAALRRAKAENVAYLFYAPEMNARVAESLRMENKLRRALENNELVLWYQPKVDVRTRELTGFEALMRWQDPGSGLVPPSQFIPLMEQTGLILAAGKWALQRVAQDCDRWMTATDKPIRIAVNVSPLQLKQKQFIPTLIEAVRNARKVGAIIDLEITESTVMEDVEAIIPTLQTIRELGVEIAIDDFGTGYSSLAYIAKLPIQALKIDRSFIVGMTQHLQNINIVKSIVSLAHSIGLKVIAEGVEAEEQVALLSQLKCDQMQGFLVSRAMPPDAIETFLPQKIIVPSDESGGVDETAGKAPGNLLRSPISDPMTRGELSHDLRNPLASLVNTLSILEMSNRGDVSAKPHLQRMERQLRQLTEVVDRWTGIWPTVQ